MWNGACLSVTSVQVVKLEGEFDLGSRRQCEWRGKGVMGAWRSGEVEEGGRWIEEELTRVDMNDTASGSLIDYRLPLIVVFLSSLLTSNEVLSTFV